MARGLFQRPNHSAGPAAQKEEEEEYTLGPGAVAQRSLHPSFGHKIRVEKDPCLERSVFRKIRV
jgi:hypothetical protein